MSPGLWLVLASLVTSDAWAVSGLATPPWGPQEPSYEERLAVAGGWPEPGLASLRSGLSVRGAGSSGAAGSLERAATLMPGFADWAYLLAADAAGRAGDTASVRRLLDRTDADLALDWGWRVRVRAKRGAGDVRGAIAVAAEAVDRLPDGPARSEAAVSLATLRLAIGDTTRARDALRRAIEGAPSSSFALDAARMLAGLRTALPEDHLLAGRLFLRHGNIERGIEGIDRYFKTGRVAAGERSALRIEINRALIAGRRYAEAEPRLRTLAADSFVGPEAMVLLGRLQIRQSKPDLARQTLRSALSRSPASAARAEALFMLADLEHDRGEIAAASALYRELVEKHAATDQAAEAAMRLGGLEYAAGRHTSAARVFDAYRAAHVEGLRSLQATFWAGLSFAAGGDTAAARPRLESVQRADPASFYGLRAGDVLGRSLRSVLLTSPISSPRTARLAEGAEARIALLEQLGLAPEAAAELARAKRHLSAQPGGLHSLAERFHAAGRVTEAVRLGREIQRAGGWSERLLRIVYPLPYRDQIFAAARQRGLDPFLVAGLIRQESLFEATARSRAGAVGLMQILPRTATSLARRDGVKGFAPSMLRDPELNLRLGTLFMADLLRQHDQTLPYVLAAYNAGPSRVARWRRQPENGDPDVFSERIPFTETRDYVRIVQANARIYAELYGDQDRD